MIQVIINQQMMDQVVKSKANKRANNNQVLVRGDSSAALKANQQDIAAVIARSRVLFHNTMALK
ncbi:hypothetical protein [Shewanella japonica]|uniref:Uncharacterized protein n=1 Tax=Shewanella japonica TaxID=93973 RepID=A0ABN4YDW9_9GAMM|nr:hypothetical protein [Shewanella japonica]ARD22636.1 hypothetical protein SJ2017_2346 [Shewanella japonica]